MPNGLSGVTAGLLAVAFAFGSIEIVAIAAAEAEDPKRSIAGTVRSTIFRITVSAWAVSPSVALLLPYSQIEGADAAAALPVYAGVAGSQYSRCRGLYGIGHCAGFAVGL